MHVKGRQERRGDKSLVPTVRSAYVFRRREQHFAKEPQSIAPPVESINVRAEVVMPAPRGVEVHSGLFSQNLFTKRSNLPGKHRMKEAHRGVERTAADRRDAAGSREDHEAIEIRGG
jgi:hypothetical protein